MLQQPRAAVSTVVCVCVVVGAIWSGNCCQPIDHRCYRRGELSIILATAATAAFPVIGLDYFIAGTQASELRLVFAQLDA